MIDALADKYNISVTDKKHKALCGSGEMCIRDSFRYVSIIKKSSEMSGFFLNSLISSSVYSFCEEAALSGVWLLSLSLIHI